MAPTTSSPSGTGRRPSRARRLTLGLVLPFALGAALMTAVPAQAAVCQGKLSSLLCTSKGTGAKKPPPPPAPTWLVSYKVWSNHIKIYKDGKLVRDVPVAGNPYLSPQLPSTCKLAQKIRVNWDVTKIWRLDYFTRLCPGRGVGTHAIPINRYDGRQSMSASQLGHTPGAGSPISHGCARMRASDAKWIYDHVPLGTTVKISYAR